MTVCDTRCGPPRCCLLQLERPLVVDDGRARGYAGVRLVRVHHRIGVGMWLSLELARRIFAPPAARWIVLCADNRQYMELAMGDYRP